MQMRDGATSLAMKLERPLAGGKLKIVARSGRRDAG
jgi:hypothetical protein